MEQHFLLSAAARSLSLAKVMRMSDRGAQVKALLDAGANIGYYSALAATCVGRSGRVFSMEPQPKTYRQLAKMVEENHLAQIRVYQCGLSATEGELPLYLQPELSGENNATMVPHGASRQVLVPVKTLDACIREWGIEKIDLLKIDVEGHEPQVFQGAAAALAESFFAPFFAASFGASSSGSTSVT